MPEANYRTRMTTAATTTTTTATSNGDFFRLGSLRISARTAKREKIKKLNNNQDRVVFAVREETARVELPPVLPPEEDDNAGTCIICVGSTGTGKSSTIAKFTGSRTKSGSGHERVTKSCEIHRSLLDDSEPVWVDTVGWDDAECEDDETFKDILRFIDKYNITKVKAVIWNISPNVRRDALLTGQARLINLFKKRDIWNNVIIVAKQSLNPESDCQGALHAAQDYVSKKPLFTGYRFYSDPTISAQQRDSFRAEETRNLFNIKTDEEIREILRDRLAEVGPPVQVVFNTKRCVNCSVAGDPRLLPAYCHMDPSFIHIGAIENHHPGGLEKFHPSSHKIHEHDGKLGRRWYYNLLCGNMRKQRYSCCGKRSGKPGCTEKWACCRLTTEDKSGGCTQRYKCCGASADLQRSGCSPRYSCCLREVDRLGCRKVCKKCGRDWASPALDCFRKEHELVDINPPPGAAAGGQRTSSSEANHLPAAPPTEEEERLLMPQPSSEKMYSGQQKPHHPGFRSSFLPNITYHII